MELTLEQKNYLHGLSSKKKRRKFLLDCLIKNVLSVEVKVSAFELKENHKTTFSTTSTAPKTFTPSGNVINDSVNIGIKALSAINEAYIKSEKELLKFDMLDSKFEEEIKNKLLTRGFSKENLLNNRGLIGATIEETSFKIAKNE